MPCYDNLGSIPNQSSRLDAGFGINIKPINSNDGVNSMGKAFKFIQKHRYILTQIENIPQKHIIYIRKEIDNQKRNLLLRYI